MRPRHARLRRGHHRQFHRRHWQWQWRARQRWHQRWHRHHARFKHSLGARLIAVFLLLALLASLIGYGALQGSVDPWAALALLLLVTGFAYASIRHLVRPLRALAAGAEAFGRGDFKHRVQVRHRDEIGDLAFRFNQMATDIQAMLDGKRALLLAISHELRSPLTRARLHAELVSEGASRDALLGELAQMRDLISALLESERLGAGHSALQREPCDLAALLQTLAQEFPGDGLELLIESGLPPLSLDRLRVQLLMRNLIDNALRHGRQVQAELRAEQGGLRFSVRDQGPGVAPETLAQLGQPFFRPDAARSRSDGGVGLGLTLCRLVAQAHGSRLELRNLQPGFEASVLFR